MFSKPFPKTFDVYVGNLPADVEKVGLEKLFGKFGKINSMSIMPDKKKEDAKSAFVRFSKEEYAEKLVKDGNLMSLAGRELFVRRGNYGRERGDGDAKPLRDNKPDLVSMNQPRMSENKQRSVCEVVKEMKIMLTHVVSPVIFWAQLMDNNKANELYDLSEKLQTVCPIAKSFAAPPPLNKVLAATFTDDNQWYRCRVVEHMEGRKSKILFIDYGNGEIKQNEEIVELPGGLASVEPFAKQFSLYGLKDAHDLDSVGYLQGQKELETLTSGKVLKTKICREGPPTNVLAAMVQCDDLDINQVMLDKGFGERKFPKQANQSDSDFSRTSQYLQFTEGRSQDIRRVEKIGTSFEPARFPVQIVNNDSDLISSSNVKLGNNKWTMDVSGGSNECHSAFQNTEVLELKEQNTEVQELKEQLRKSELDREQQLSKLAVISQQLKSVSEEYSVTAAKIAEVDLSSKIKTLIGGVHSVRILRRQFPTDDELCRDNITHAVSLLTNKEETFVPVDPIVAQNAEHALAQYKNAQHKIKLCTDQNELEELIEKRDELRREAHKNLIAYQEATSQLRMSEKVDILKEAITSLESSHTAFLKFDCEERDTEEVADIYGTWKERNLSDFKEIRTHTNTCHNTVNSAIQLLQQQLSLDLTGGSDAIGGVLGAYNLNILLTKFQDAINSEIMQTDMTANRENSTSLAVIVKSLMNGLKSALHDAERFLKQTSEFSTELNQVEPWLTKKPDARVLEIQGLKKEVKSLKSKLRHKLADLQDLEENEGNVADELMVVREELGKLRLELQRAYEKEEKCLGEFPELWEKHFPELHLQYPDLGLDTFLKHNGLVKNGRSVDQYDTQKMNTGTKTILKTSYCGNPVALKEYLVDESVGVKREDFISDVVAYQKVKSRHLLPLDFIFFEQNKYQAFVQLPFQEHSLTSAVNSGLISHELVWNVLNDVLEGLVDLHHAGLAHGALHPDNVFVDSDGHAMLAECDFSKSLLKLKDKAFITSNGLQFYAPEMDFNKEESLKAGDMYNFGLLALWIHHPHDVIPMRTLGVPDTSALEMTEPLTRLIESLLLPNPEERCTADSLTQLHFFSAANEGLSKAAQDQTLQLRPRQTTPLEKNDGGILKKSPKRENAAYTHTSPHLLNTVSSSEIKSTGECIKVDGELPDINKHSSNTGTKFPFEEIFNNSIQKTEFSPIIQPLPCTPMGTPGNTPTETSVGSKEHPGNSPRQSIANTLQKVADLVAQERDGNLVGMTEEELRRNSEIGGVDSD